MNTPHVAQLQSRHPGLQQAMILVEDGWFDLLYTGFLTVPWDVQVSEINRAAGGLHFCFAPKHSSVARYFTDMIGQSRQICEMCGKPGSLILRESQLLTRCLDC